MVTSVRRQIPPEQELLPYQQARDLRIKYRKALSQRKKQIRYLKGSGSPPQPTRLVSGVISILHSFFEVIYTIDNERGWSRG